MNFDRGLRRLRIIARPVPGLHDIAADLLTVGLRRVWWMAVRPLGLVAAFFVTDLQPWFRVALAAAIMVSTIALMHDLLHASLGLRPRHNDVALLLASAVILEAGHVLQRTHRRHHRWFPDLDRDPEASFARCGGVVRALAEGPIYRYRLWWWAWRHEPGARRWIAVEVGLHVGAVLAAASVRWPMFTTYVVLMVMGSWLFPVVSVLGVHDIGADRATQWTRSLHGRVLPRLIVNQGFHLEHHLWPAVPSANLPELARRAERFLQAERAPIAHVP